MWGWPSWRGGTFGKCSSSTRPCPLLSKSLTFLETKDSAAATACRGTQTWFGVPGSCVRAALGVGVGALGTCFSSLGGAAAPAPSRRLSGALHCRVSTRTWGGHWGGQRGSTQLRMGDWKPLLSHPFLHPSDSLSVYTHSVPGPRDGISSTCNTHRGSSGGTHIKRGGSSGLGQRRWEGRVVRLLVAPRPWSLLPGHFHMLLPQGPFPPAVGHWWSWPPLTWAHHQLPAVPTTLYLAPRGPLAWLSMTP